MRLATQIRYCASCHNQNVKLRHVDFDAYWDGPTFEDKELKLTVAIDDLIICEDCLAAAATLLGFVDDSKMREENEELGRALDEKNKQLQAARDVIRDLQRATNNALAGNITAGKGNASKDARELVGMEA